MPENNAVLAFGAGGLSEPLLQLTTLAPANTLKFPAPVLPGLVVRLNPTAGTFSGSFTHPQTTKATPFRGVILQKQGSGFGFFAGGVNAGAAAFSPTEMQQEPPAAE